MDALDSKSRMFATVLDELMTLVDAHVAVEEKQISPKSQDVIGDARAEVLATAKQVNQTEMTGTKP